MHRLQVLALNRAKLGGSLPPEWGRLGVTSLLLDGNDLKVCVAVLSTVAARGDPLVGEVSCRMGGSH